MLGIFGEDLRRVQSGISGALVFGYLGAIVFRLGMQRNEGTRRETRARTLVVPGGFLWKRREC